MDWYRGRKLAIRLGYIMYYTCGIRTWDSESLQFLPMVMGFSSTTNIVQQTLGSWKVKLASEATDGRNTFRSSLSVGIDAI